MNFDPKDFQKAAEGLRRVVEGNAAIQQAQQQTGQRVQSALRAAIGLPEQMDRLTEEVGKLAVVANAQFEIAQAQNQFSEEAAKRTKILTEQTDRLINETIKLTRFTKGLVWLTVVLAGFATIQIIIMLFDYFSKNH